MKVNKIVIIGGGTAGWMAASFLIKEKPNWDITVVESDKIPIIGVGESVTQHVAAFFDYLGIPTHDWMLKTGAVYKYANKFINWRTNSGEAEYFSFNLTISENNFYKDISENKTMDELSNDMESSRSIDYLVHLCNNEGFEQFDRYFSPQFHYMEKNVAPFRNKEGLLNQVLSSSHHINAELAGKYLCHEYAKPRGVKHIIGKVKTINNTGDNINSIVLDNGETITSDLFIDCTGFHRVLVGHLGWPVKEYTNNPIDSAWVCQTVYEDQAKEMVNYTQSIAEPHGWRFKIGLYHRMGNGYCFSSKHVTDEKAREHFLTQIKNPKAEPRLIKWKPSRLLKFGGGNVCAIGLSCGFVEPLEANSLYTIFTSIIRLIEIISKDQIDFTMYNQKMEYTIDDIADFLLVHYTLSSRTDTDFWNDMRELGKKLNHVDLIQQKIDEPRNSIKAAMIGYTLFPDYMWSQLAISWKIPVQHKNLDPLSLELARNYFKYKEHKNNLISDTMEPNYVWHRKNVFKDMDCETWMIKHLLSK